MVLFPFAKINIGLEVLRKRPDNFHDLETIFYPLSLCDILEIIKSDALSFTISGLQICDSPEENIVIKAYNLLKSECDLSPVHIHLHKKIPTGAGLGGGSSDAAFTLIGLNELFKLNLNDKQMMCYATMLGSDCTFFLLNQPVFAEGKGNIFSNTKINLKDFTVVVVKPKCSVSTSAAYYNIEPHIPKYSLNDSVELPISEWRERVENRFEETIFISYPEINIIKDKLYGAGAIFASMSGSGSSVFGLFEKVDINLKYLFPDCFYWQEICPF